MIDSSAPERYVTAAAAKQTQTRRYPNSWKSDCIAYQSTVQTAVMQVKQAASFFFLLPTCSMHRLARLLLDEERIVSMLYIN